MKKKIRFIAMILGHVGLLFSIGYLVFFFVCSAKACTAAKALKDPDAAETVTEEDVHLENAVHEKDFSVLSVGRAISEKENPARDNFLLILDLIIPVLFLAAGILLQIASVRKKRKTAAPPQSGAPRSRSIQTTIKRRQ